VRLTFTQIVPPHVRRGLLRLYLVVAVPSVSWFGFRVLDASSHYRSHRASESSRRALAAQLRAQASLLAKPQMAQERRALEAAIDQD